MSYRERDQENMIGNYIRTNVVDSSGYSKPLTVKGEIPYTVYLAVNWDKSDKGKTKMTNIGTFYLGSTAACGDYVDLGGADRTYEIKRVTHVYRYENSKFVVYRRKLDVVNASPSCLKVIKSTDITGGILQ